MYSHLTQAQRYTISNIRKNGCTLKVITKELARLETEAAIEAGLPIPQREYSVSTISRVLRRNRTQKGIYNPKLADEMAQERSERVVHNSALKPGVLQRAISLLIEKRWSPEQISGYLKKQEVKISKERIYQEIRMRPELHKYCHHKMKYRRHKAHRVKWQVRIRHSIMFRFYEGLRRRVSPAIM